MPRTRKANVATEEEKLPIRSPSKKRKLEEAEQNSDDEPPISKSKPAKVTAAAKEKNTSTKSQSKRGKNDQPLQNGVVTDDIPESSPKSRKTKTEIARNKSTPSRSQEAKATKEEEDFNVEYSEDEKLIKSPARGKKGPTKTKPKDKSEAAEESVEEAGASKPTKKRKTKEEKEAEAMPLASRSSGLKMYVGAHTSIAKGVENAITNAVHIGGNAFAMFLKSQRKWDNPALKDENREAFKEHLVQHKFDAASHILPHGSYLVNLASENEEMAKKSYDGFIDDLRRCEALGIVHYNFHPGAAGQSSMDTAISRLAKQLNRALSETKTVIPVLENMATRGSVIGGKFSDLRDIIAQIEPKYKSRIGVCIDTCHTFASGYDLRTPEAFQKTMKEFDDTVGIKYLKALHLNDSKAPLASNRDLHQNIGLGFLGLRAFHNIMNEPRFQNLPLILETPCDKPDPKDPTGKKTLEDKGTWAREIKLLESLIGMDPNGTEFKNLEKELSEKGKAERAKMQKSVDDKTAKANRKASKEKEKGQKSVKDMFGGKGKKKGAKASSDSEMSDEEEADTQQVVAA